MWFTRYILFILGLVYISAAKHFRYDYKYDKASNAWLKLHTAKKSWHEARKTCILEDATLASPLDVNLTTAICNIIEGNDSNSTYLGLHSTFSRGIWHSVEGTFTPWVAGCLNSNASNGNTGDPRCVLQHPCGSMSAVDCKELHSFVCYNRGEPSDSTCGSVDRAYKLDKRTGNCYKFHVLAETWWKAYEVCSIEGAHLAIVNSNAEAEVLKELLLKNINATVNSEHPTYAHIGFANWENNNIWYTIHGELLQDSGYSTWEPGEPNNKFNDESCGSIFASGLLNDMGCKNKVAFICEKDINSVDMINIDFTNECC